MDKPYKDIVLHLEREMQLNGLGAPDETTSNPLNAVDAAPPDQQQRGHCFHCGRYGHYKAQCRKLKKDRYYENMLKSNEIHPNGPQKPKKAHVGKRIKLKTAGTEPMQQTIREESDTNLQSPPIKSVNILCTYLQTNQKTKIAAPTFRGKGRREDICN